jgi:hypothetical protein
VILEMARHLAKSLRQRDPLALRVELGGIRFALAALLGLGRMQWLLRGPTPSKPLGEALR